MIECPSCNFENADHASKCQKCQAELFGRDPVCAMPTFGGTSAGQVLDRRYVIAQRIGDDGAGVLYHADDAQTNTPVLIRALPTFIPDDTKEINEIRRKAKALLHLKHANIAQLLGFELEGPVKYFVSEQVQGIALAQKLARTGPLTTEQASAIFEPLGESLDYAHSQNHIHCDIHPANIILTPDGPPKLANFEITRWIKGELAKVTGDQPIDASLYSAPEQFRTGKSHPKSDIYSFAATIYQSLCRPPLIWRGWIEYQVLNEKPLSLHDLTDEQNAALLKALSRDSKFRYRSTYKFLTDLNLASKQTSPHPLPSLQTGDKTKKQTGLPQQALGNLGANIDADLKAETEARRKAEEKAAEEAKAREIAEKKAEEQEEKLAEETRAKNEAQRRTATEARAKAEAQERAAKETQARKEAEEKARKTAVNLAEETNARKLAEQQAQEEAKKRDEIEAQARKKIQAEENARIEAEKKARMEQEKNARLEAKLKKKDNATIEKLAKIEAKAKAKAEKKAYKKEIAETRKKLEEETAARAQAEEKLAQQIKAKSAIEEQAKEYARELVLAQTARSDPELETITDDTIYSPPNLIDRQQADQPPKKSAKLKKILAAAVIIVITALAAVLYLNAIKDPPQAVQDWANAQRAATAQLDYPQAIKTANTLIAEFPKFADKHRIPEFKTAWIEAFAADKAHQIWQEIEQLLATADYENAIKKAALILKEHPKTPYAARATAGIPLWQEILDRDKRFAKLFAEAQAAQDANDLDAALKAITSALELEPGNASATLMKNTLDAQKQWRIELAQKAQALIAEALAYQSSDNFPRAIDIYEKAARLMPDDPQIPDAIAFCRYSMHLSNAQAALSKQNFDAAMQSYEKARDFARKPELKQNLESLIEKLNKKRSDLETRRLVIQWIKSASEAETTGDLEAAVKYYRKAADANDPTAMHKLALAYYNGNGIDQNITDALQWFEKAADAGDSNSMFRLGLIYHAGDGVEKDSQKAADWYKKAADAQNPEAMHNLGAMYYSGQGVVKDVNQAVTWLEKAANAGNVQAMYNVAVAYYNGEEITKDYAKAVEWFRKAADANDVPAIYNLALAYLDIADYTNANLWFAKAANAGNREAMYNLGVMYYNAYGVNRDFEAAGKWYVKAAEKGETNAMVNLGLMHEEGLGTPKDPDKAVQWYLKAAENANPRGMANLAMAYYQGEGLKKDPEKAVQWLQKAANLGEPMAMFNLAIMYKTGEGIEKDTEKAITWLKKAADLGYPQAKQELNKLNRSE